MTRPDITFVVGALSKFMHQPREVHWLAAMRILTNIRVLQEKGWYTGNMGMHVFLDTLIQLCYASDRGDRTFTTGYCTFLEKIW